MKKQQQTNLADELAVKLGKVLFGVFVVRYILQFSTNLTFIIVLCCSNLASRCSTLPWPMQQPASKSFAHIWIREITPKTDLFGPAQELRCHAQSSILLPVVGARFTVQALFSHFRFHTVSIAKHDYANSFLQYAGFKT